MFAPKPQEAKAATPDLTFISPPTPAHNTYQAATSAEINISIDEPDLNSFIFNWNSANHIFYDDSLVLGMNLDNNSALGENSTSTYDFSMYGNNGTINGATWTSSGKYSSALSFDGNDYVDLGDINSGVFNGTNTQLSFSGWINCTNLSVTNTIISKYNSNDAGNVHQTFTFYVMDSGKLRVAVFKDNSAGDYFYFKTNDVVIQASTWHHVGFVVDLSSQNIKIYVDGVEKPSTKTTSGTPPTVFDNTNVSVNIGDIVAGGAGSRTGFFYGSIDEVRLYKSTLTQDEMEMNYYSNLQKYGSSQWYFDSNITNLTDGAYTYYGWADNVGGDSSYTAGYTASSPRYLNIVTLPIVTINSPVNGSRDYTASTTVTLNVSFSKTVATAWYQLDSNGTNITLCADCSSAATTTDVQTIGDHSITVYADGGLIGSATTSFSVKQQPLFTFAVISDPHIGKTADDATYCMLGSKDDELLETAVSDINAYKPAVDFTVITGDISDQETAAQLSTANSLLSELNAPFYPVAGNHDNFQSDNKLAFINTFNLSSVNYTWDFGGFHFITIDPTLNPYSSPYSNFTEDLRNWAASDLNSNSHKQTFLFTHYHLLPYSYWEGSVTSSVTGSDELRTVLENAGNVVTTIGGHMHFNRHGTENGVSYITIGSTIVHPSPISYFHVYENRVEVVQSKISSTTLTDAVTNLCPESERDYRDGGEANKTFTIDYPDNVFAPTIRTPNLLSSSAIRWNFTDNSDNETGFRVYTNADAITTSSATANLTYLDENGLSENTQYTRYVKAYNSYGESASSSATFTFTLMNAPIGFSFDTVTTNSLTISASGTLTNLASSTSGVYFDETSGNSGGADSTWLQTNSYQNSGLSENTQYTYRVKARNGDGTATSYTATSSKYTLTDTPTGFGFLRHPLSLDIYVDRFPNSNSDSSGYLFWRADNSSYNSGWIQTNTWQDPNMIEGQTYTYGVKYRNGDGIETATTTLSGVWFISEVGGGGSPTVQEQATTTVSATSTQTTASATTTTNSIATSTAATSTNTISKQTSTPSSQTNQTKQAVLQQIKAQIIVIQQKLIELISLYIKILQDELARMFGR